MSERIGAIEKSKCQEFACAIQTCLASNDYMESKCEKEIKALMDCCKSNNYPEPNCFQPQSKK